MLGTRQQHLRRRQPERVVESQARVEVQLCRLLGVRRIVELSARHVAGHIGFDERQLTSIRPYELAAQNVQ